MEEKENKLVELSMQFAVEIINLVKELSSKREFVISNQIGRSGTSIGANIHEAQYAQGIKDFVWKLKIALKESNEMSFWLNLLLKTNFIDKTRFEELENVCSHIRTLLVKSCKTAKDNI